MKFKLVSSLLFIALLGTHTSYAASPEILPGLWEMKMEMSSESGQLEEAMEQARAMMEQMPPEQQAMIKSMMESRGMNLDFGNTTIQYCLTQARIDNFDMPQADDGCTQSFEESGAGQFKMTLSCPDQNMQGEGEFVVNNEKSYTGEIVMQGEINGMSDTMIMNQTGTWLDSDCGDVAE